MDKKKQLVFNYFDTIYSGYEKQGRRPVNMSYPYVLFEYKNSKGNKAFNYNTQTNTIRFNDSDYYTVKNMFGLETPELSNICRQYVMDKFDNPSAMSASLFPSDTIK